MPNHRASKSCAQLAVCEKQRIQLTDENSSEEEVGSSSNSNLGIISKKGVWAWSDGRDFSTLPIMSS